MSFNLGIGDKELGFMGRVWGEVKSSLSGVCVKQTTYEVVKHSDLV